MTTTEFSYQIEALKSPLMNSAVRLTRNREDANDLVQETMGKAFKHLESFQVGTNFRAWIITIMRNLFINQYRKKKVRNMRMESIDDHFYSLEAAGIANQGESTMMLQEIQKAINSLDRDYSLPFTMHVQGYKYDEIAHYLNIPLGTVKSRIFIARKKLRRNIDHIYNN